MRGAAQGREQRAAVHAEAVPALPQARVGQVHEAPAADRRPDDVVDPRRARADLVEDAEALEHRDPGRLQQQPGTDRAWVGRAFQDLDLVLPRGRAAPPPPALRSPLHDANSASQNS